MPIVRFFEDKSKFFKISTFQQIFNWPFSYFHNLFHVFEGLEGFLPEPKFSCQIELFHSNFNVVSVHLFFLNIDIIIFLDFRFVSPFI